MTHPKILVTGATGKTGGALAAQLLADGWPVRAVVRRRDARSERLDRLGAETVVADLYDPEQLVAAMKGAPRAYYCPPVQPYMIQSAAAFAVAARDAGLESVVQMSQWLSSPNHPALMTRQTWLVDQTFAMIPGVAHTIVNPGVFADITLSAAIGLAANLGLFPLFPGDRRLALPSCEDIARVAAAVLKEPDGHAGRRYRPTGPERLSGDEMAAIIGRVLGRKVRGVPANFRMLDKTARIQGMPQYETGIVRHYFEDHLLGAFNVDEPTTDVLDVTGKPAEDFEATVRRYAARPEARRTVGNFFKTLGGFLLTPFSPGYNHARFERHLGFPVPARPLLAAQSERWKAERDQQSSHRLTGPRRSGVGGKSMTADGSILAVSATPKATSK